MINQKDQKGYDLIKERKRSFASDNNRLGQYDEEDDFLCGKVPALLPDFSQEEEEE